MIHKEFLQRVLSVSTVLIFVSLFILSACSPAKTATPATPDLQATIDALQTQMAQNSQATTPPPAEPSTKPTPTFSDFQSEYAGFMVFTNQKYVSLDFNGEPLGFNVDAPGVEGLSLRDVSVFIDGLILSSVMDMKIHMVTSQSNSTLDYISLEKPVVAVVSPDGTKIAWAYQYYSSDAPGSELWIANIDGSAAQKIDEILPADNTDRWLIFRPAEWTRDGKLLYGTKLTGIGGYILFDGWNSLRLYDPADGSRITLVEEQTGMCINSLSADRSLAAIGCNPMRVRTLADGSEITLPALVEQNTSGSAMFSPSGAWLAYATGKVDPENERSQVVIAATNGSSEPYPIQTMEGGVYHILGWINEDTLLFDAHEQHDNIHTIWRIDRDGSRPTQLIEAQFLGLMPK